MAIAYKHVQEAPPPLRSLNPDVPDGYEAITRKLLAKNPANRYASAEDLRADLRRFCDGPPVLAEPVLVPPVEDAPDGDGRLRHTAVPVRPTLRRPRTATGPRTGWFFVVVLVLLGVLGGLLFVVRPDARHPRHEAGDGRRPTGHRRAPHQARPDLTAKGFKVTSQDQESATVAEGHGHRLQPEGRHPGRQGLDGAARR